MDEHDMLMALRQAEKRLGIADAAVHAAKEDLKAVRGEQRLALTALRELAGDTADGQARINFDTSEAPRRQDGVSESTAAGATEASTPPPDGPDWRKKRVTVLGLGKPLTAKLQAHGIFFMGELADRANKDRLVETCGMTYVHANRFAAACSKFYAEHKVGQTAKQPSETIDGSTGNDPAGITT